MERRRQSTVISKNPTRSTLIVLLKDFLKTIPEDSRPVGPHHSNCRRPLTVPFVFFDYSVTLISVLWWIHKRHSLIFSTTFCSVHQLTNSLLKLICKISETTQYYDLWEQPLYFIGRLRNFSYSHPVSTFLSLNVYKWQ